MVGERRKPGALISIQMEGEGFPPPPHPQGMVEVGVQEDKGKPQFWPQSLPQAKGKKARAADKGQGAQEGDQERRSR